MEPTRRFSRIFAELAAIGGKPDRLMIDAVPKAKALLADRSYDAYFGRAWAIIKQRERIKRQTIEHRRLKHRKLAS